MSDAVAPFAPVARRISFSSRRMLIGHRACRPPFVVHSTRSPLYLWPIVLGVPFAVDVRTTHVCWAVMLVFSSVGASEAPTAVVARTRCDMLAPSRLDAVVLQDVVGSRGPSARPCTYAPRHPHLPSFMRLPAGLHSRARVCPVSREGYDNDSKGVNGAHTHMGKQTGSLRAVPPGF